MMDAEQHPTISSESGRRALVFDVDAYRPRLSEFALTPDQEQELLQALWSVMVTIVDLRFRMHPVQQANGDAADIPLDQILAAMLASPEENSNNSNEITARGGNRSSAEKEDS